MSDYVTPSPDIKTERLVLRGWRAEDSGLVKAIYGDPETARFIGGELSPEQSWRAFATTVGHWHLRGFGLCVVEQRATATAIGWCGHWYPEGWAEPEIGYAFIASAHGKGFATEAANAALIHAYETLGWATAVSFIDPANAPSQSVARRVGASKTGGTFTLRPGHTGDIWRHLAPDRFRERSNAAA